MITTVWWYVIASDSGLLAVNLNKCWVKSKVDYLGCKWTDQTPETGRSYIKVGGPKDEDWSI